MTYVTRISGAGCAATSRSRWRAPISSCQRPFSTKPQIAQVREDLGREGYVQIDGFFDRDYVTRLAQGIHALRGNGLLPVFGLVFDEYWNLARRAGDLLRHLLGAEYSQLPDFWSWYLDPATEERLGTAPGQRTR